MRILLQILVIVLFVGSTIAQGSNKSVQMNLKQCLERALSVSPDIEQAILEVEKLEAGLSQAKFASIVPRLQWTGILGPAPGIAGDIENVETIRSDLSSIGLFSQTKFELVQPLYTFGKLSNTRKAAKFGLEAGEAAVELKKAKIVLQVKKLFFGLLLASRLHEIVLESEIKVGNARKLVTQMIEEDSEVVGQNDLLRIDVFEYETRKNKTKVETSIKMSKAALMKLLEIDRSTDFEIIYPDIIDYGVVLEGLSIYIKKAKNRRYDLKQLQAGVVVRRALMKVSKSDFYPQIALAGTLQWGIAPHRPELDNPFLKDEFNFFRGGAVITLKQNFNFGLTRAKYLTRRAELESLISKQSQAMNVIELEVEKTYRQVIDALSNMKDSDRAFRSAKAWLTSAKMGFDVNGDITELLNAHTAYARMQEEYERSIFGLQVSLSELDYVTGEKY